MAEAKKCFGSLQPRFYGVLNNCERILLAGCGGGFDIFQGIPLLCHLKSMGKEVHLANLSFVAEHQLAKVPQLCDTVWKVEANSGLEKLGYCPEAFLAQYLNEEFGLDMPVYLIARRGYKAVKRSYERILQEINADCIVLIDGGSDSFMKGNEFGIGTVEEDYTSMLSVHDLEVDGLNVKLLAALGIGIDRFHEVSDVASLRAISEVHESGGFLGSQMLMSGTQPVDAFVRAVEYASEKTHTPSIVGCCIRDAMIGKFGNYHSNFRTKGSKLFINPIMALLSVFDLKVMVDRIHPEFKQSFRECETMMEVRLAVRKSREVLEDADKILDEEDYPATSDRY